ncbi:acyl-CoA dehydrogenase family protein [Paenimyroides aestuarii]|uniref:Acyl-CoA dehydrogenase n=1 Tax=Paenimyroides aestuarii TaxID=2968490 RepID=A0ABY5NUV2_9FLAO|nr:hypothetical protein [Paenimyroides aestuarii]UUV22234.1 hypothetical protein NPX36_04140 [Paenimyroides aestuarii]
MDSFKIQQKLLEAKEIPADVMEHIYNERWLQIWVPKRYGGLGLSFINGLKLLKSLAFIDGSLGWMVTLCAGANYFSRNLKPDIAKELFKDNFTCFGGSGAIGGTAEKLNDFYLINGRWTFATGAPHLSHFTLNAVVTENDQPVLDENGKELVRSFIIPKDQAEIIADWNAMGMQATGTFSFTVDNVLVDVHHSFIYNEFYTDAVLDRIPFRIFADLTLLVNYLGMAAHFLDEAEKIRPQLDLTAFRNDLSSEENKTYLFANKMETLLENQQKITTEVQTEIHQFGETLVANLSHRILDLYFQLGIKASHTNEPIQQIFCDYFTATQHANFRRVCS